MKSGVFIKEATDAIKNIWGGIKFVTKMEVNIGVLEDAAPRDDSMTNAQLLYLHENGSPVNNMPARPVVKNAMQRPETKRMMNERLRTGALLAITGRLEEAKAAYEEAGEIGTEAVKLEFTSGSLAPNAPITINGGWMRNNVSGKPVYIEGKGADSPLIDSGQLLNSIGYEIREKK